MRKYEIEIQNLQGRINNLGGVNLVSDEKSSMTYSLTLESDAPARIELCDSNTKRLLGIFELGTETISLIKSGSESEREYTVDIAKVGDEHVFPTNPPIRFKKVNL